MIKRNREEEGEERRGRKDGRQSSKRGGRKTIKRDERE